MSEFVVTNKTTKKKISIKNSKEVLLNGIIYNYELEQISESTYSLRLDSKVFELHSKKINDELFSITAGSNNYDITVRTALQEKALELLSIKNSLNHKTEIKAPMPGMILKIKKQPGDIVTQGVSVMILEAMKMENDLRSTTSGTIKTINVKEGNPVEKGTVLFTIE